MGPKTVAEPSPLGVAHRASLKPAARSVEKGNPFRRAGHALTSKSRQLPDLEEADMADAEMEDTLPDDEPAETLGMACPPSGRQIQRVLMPAGIRKVSRMYLHLTRSGQ